MGGKDEEHTEDVADPGEGVQEVDPPCRVLRNEEVQQGQRDRVAREHVVPARADTLKSHPGSRPDDERVVQLVPDVTVRSRLALQSWKHWLEDFPLFFSFGTHV